MQYLRLRRSRLIVGAFVLFALFALAFPEVDLWVSGWFFDGQSFLRDQWWQKLLQDGLRYFLVAAVAVPLTFYLINKCRQRGADCAVNGRKIVYLLLVIVLGAGLVVNAGLKDQFGRARPRDIVEFGGVRQFTPAFVISDQCRTNCSFSSGDVAAASVSLALVLAFRRRRAWVAAALALGGVVAFARLAAGAHFLSDTVTSFFVMLLMADVLFYYVVLNPAGRQNALARREQVFGAPATPVF